MGMPLSDTYSEENEFVPPIATSRIVRAAWDSGVEDRETNLLAKHMARKDLSKIGDKISPEKLNTQFEGLNADREMTAQEAQFVYDGKQEQRKRDAILSEAGGFWQGTALPFAVGAASSMADPIGFAVGALTGSMIGKFGSRLVTKSAVKAGTSGLTKLEISVFSKSLAKQSLSKVEKKVMQDITKKTALKGAKKFTQDVVDNSIGNSLAEGLVWKDRQETFEEYTAKDFLQNAIGGSIMMTGAIHGGAKLLRSSAKLGDKFLSNNQQVVDTLMENGKKLDAVDDMVKIADTAITHTDESNVIIKESFGDKVEVGETLADTAENIREAYKKGDLNDADIENYRSRVNESSVVDDRAIDMIDPDYTFKYTDTEMDAFNTKVSDKSSDIGFDKDIEEKSDSLNSYDPTDETALNEEIDAIFQTKTEGDVEGGAVDLDPETTAIKTEMDQDIELTKVQEDYARCRTL